MKDQALVRKYAEGLAGALRDETEFEAVGTEVRAFLGLFSSHEELRKSLVSPFVNARKRAAVLDEVLSRTGTGPKASRFLSLLLRHKRMELLSAVAAALPEAWSDKHGVVSFEATSAEPLTAAQKERLEKGLEASENKRVRLVYRTDPAVIGGLALRKGHIVYDASVEGRLAALQERLGQG